MTTYIFKMVLCSAVLLLFYRLFLEGEKMHRFNRFFLLIGLAFSFLVPLVNIETSTAILPVQNVIVVANNSINNAFVPQQTAAISVQGPNYLLICYIIIAGFLLLRFIKNTLSLLYKTRRNETVEFGDATLVLLKEKLMPHSYLHYIFLNKTDYESNGIEPEVLNHEMTHVKQKHTIDIMLVELAIVIAWFNPLLYLYKRSIRLNHEYLADEKVVSALPDPATYQLLLLNKLHEQNNISLTSQFNYLITKKRLIMMTKITSLTRAYIKQTAVLLLLSVSLFVFGKRTVAQDETKLFSMVSETGSTKDGASEELLSEYDEIVDKYKSNITQPEWWRLFGRQVTEQDRNRMETIYNQMSRDQQQKQTVFFVAPLPARKTIVPTIEELDTWKDPNLYGVWIDNKRVQNEELKNFTPASFASVIVTTANKDATDYRKYYQVNLMTNDRFRESNQRDGINRNTLMFRVRAVTITKLADLFRLQVFSELPQNGEGC